MKITIAVLKFSLVNFFALFLISSTFAQAEKQKATGAVEQYQCLLCGWTAIMKCAPNPANVFIAK